MNEPPKFDDPYLSPQEPGNSDPGNTSSCLKILLIWGLPLFAVPLLVAVCGSAWPVGVLFAIGFLVWIGMISAIDFSRSTGGNAEPKTRRVVLYVVLQLIWIPLFWCAVIWGLCATIK